MKPWLGRAIALGAIVLAASLVARAQSIISCSSGFTSATAACGVTIASGSNAFNLISNTGSVATRLTLIATNAPTHQSISLVYQTRVNVQAFTATMLFVPNGQNIGFTLENTDVSGYSQPGNLFLAGAGCESGFYQAAGGGGTVVSPNKVFAVQLDSYSPITLAGSFTYSSTQMYQMNQSPCIPNDAGNGYWPTNKISTSPVPLNSPAATQNTSTGDTYSATISYDGSTLAENLFDVTAGGSCPGSTCFTHTWPNVSIPTLVDGTTAYLAIVAGMGTSAPYPLYLSGLSYTVNTPTASPGGFVAYNANSTSNNGTISAASPVFSIAPGVYSGSQAITITDSTSGANLCYLAASSQPVLLPQADGQGHCLVGTPYTAPVTISSSQTLYANAGTNTAGPNSATTAAAYTISSATPPISIQITGPVKLSGSVTF